MLELKIYRPSKLDDHLAQLRRYQQSLEQSAGRPAAAYLILLDQERQRSWSDDVRRQNRDGIEIRLVHVNRPRASSSRAGDIASLPR